MTSRILFAASLVSLLAAGCAAPFDPASRIERERVLGARSEVQGDPSRAWPAPGETADLSFLVADPQEQSDVKPLSWSLAACVSATGTAAAPMCDGEPFLFTTGTGVPALPIIAPDAGAVLVAGVVCAGGEPAMSGEGIPSCEGDGVETTPVALTMFVEQDGATNHNPDLSDDEVTLDGEPWAATAPADPSAPCSASALPQVGEGDTVTIALTVDAADREEIEGGDVTREPLQVSHFVTAGRLENQFSMIESGEGGEQDTIEVEWKAPRDAAGSGELVRVHFVARDRRGGVDWTSREVCVVPD